VAPPSQASTTISTLDTRNMGATMMGYWMPKTLVKEGFNLNFIYFNQRYLHFSKFAYTDFSIWDSIKYILM
jgi:hypothetical protein